MAGSVQTLRIAAKCSRSQHRRLSEVFRSCAELYNACLQEWRDNYRWWRRHHGDSVPYPRELNHSLYDRMKILTGVREDRPEWGRLSVTVGRGVLCRFDRAVKAYYKRCADPAKRAGYPRFKAGRRWGSIEIVDPTPSMLVSPNTPKNQSARWWRLSVKGVPRLRFADRHDRLAAALGSGSEVVELRVVCTPLRVEVHVVLRHPQREVTPEVPENPVRIDKGLKQRMVLSDHSSVAARSEPDEVTKAALRAKRRFSRAKKGLQQPAPLRPCLRQDMPTGTRTRYPGGLPTRARPGYEVRRYSRRRPQRGGDIAFPPVLQESVRTAMVIIRPHPRISS